MSALERIPLVDLLGQHRSLEPEIRRAFDRVMSSSSFILGQEVEAFEAAFGRFCSVPHCVGVSSGTDALEQALAALGVGPGDEVITVAHTFIATAEAICSVGAVPVFVDVRPDTLLMDPALLEPAVTPRTRAIIPVHLYGQMVDLDPVLEVAHRHGLKVIEDCAQAHGAELDGRRAGSLGDAGAFSFYPGKNLGACGDAGCVTCRDERLAARIRQARNHGRTDKYLHEFVGRNARMDGLQGAILAAKLPRLADWNAARRRIASRYDAALARLPEVERLTVSPRVLPACHLYVVRVPRRDRVLRGLQERGVEAGIHYPVPLHLQPAFRCLGKGAGSFPVTEAAAGGILSLPIWPGMTDATVDRVVEALETSLSLEDSLENGRSYRPAPGIPEGTTGIPGHKLLGSL